MMVADAISASTFIIWPSLTVRLEALNMWKSKAGLNALIGDFKVIN
jgi:hypothetical protein